MAKKQIGDIEYNVEFNDSVLSTQTWNNPRYNGSKTQTQVLNKFTQGDITYGKKTAIQKYTRNIYVGETITACSSSNSDDLSLLPIKGFSYLTTTKYITINEDDTVDEKRYSDNILDEKRGFYRVFLEDFKAGTNCQIFLLNENITNTLNSQYIVYFADGKLIKHLHVKNNGNTNIQIAGSGKFRYIDTDGADQDSLTDVTATVFNEYGADLYFTSSRGIAEYKDLENYFNDSTTYSSDDPENRFFLTLTTGSEGLTFFDIDQNNNNRRGIKTYEIQNNAGLDRVVALSTKFGSSLSDHGSGNNPSYFVSLLNDSTPSVLINLDKDIELPNGLLAGQYLGDVFNTDPAQRIGPKFVIIPENLHPYIKDNINYFLTQAGFIEENNSLTINPKNRQLS